jgi:hypothetical protein
MEDAIARSRFCAPIAQAVATLLFIFDAAGTLQIIPKRTASCLAFAIRDCTPIGSVSSSQVIAKGRNTHRNVVRAVYFSFPLM